MIRATDIMNHRITAAFIVLIGGGLYLFYAIYFPFLHRHDNDFRHMYFGMKALLDQSEPYSLRALHYQAARSGLDPMRLSYNPYVYLPFTGLSMAFLWPFTLENASKIWFALNHIFLLTTVWLIVQMFFPMRKITAFFIICGLLSWNHSLLRTLTAGQLNLVLLLCFTATFYALFHNRPIIAGILSGFNFLFKLSPGILLPYFLLTRKAKSLFAMILSSIVFMILSVFIVGMKIHLLFLPVLQQMGYGKSTWAEYGQTFWKDPTNQSINSLMTHLLAPPYSQTTANIATYAAVLPLIGIYLYKAFRLGAPGPGSIFRNNASDQGLFCLSVITALLVPSIFWDHYTVILLLPFAWLASASLQMKRYKTFVAVIGAYIMTAIPWNYNSSVFQSGILIPLASIKLFPTLLIFWLTLRFMEWKIVNEKFTK